MSESIELLNQLKNGVDTGSQRSIEEIAALWAIEETNNYADRDDEDIEAQLLDLQMQGYKFNFRSAWLIAKGLIA